MSLLGIFVAAAIVAVLLLATCAIVAVRRWWRRLDAERNAAQRRIIDLRSRIVDVPRSERPRHGVGDDLGHAPRYVVDEGATS